MKNRLKEFRNKHNYSQSEIADVVGISQSQYAKYENGKTIFGLKDVGWAALADLFNTDISYLMGLTDVKSKSNKSIESKGLLDSGYSNTTENARMKYAMKEIVMILLSTYCSEDESSKITVSVDIEYVDGEYKISYKGYAI